MADNMYDEKGLLKPEYELTDSQKREMLYYNNLDKVDNRTDYGKGIYYKGADCREYATMDQVRAANKAYFDYLNSSFNTDDKNMSQDAFKARQEEILSYIRERYGDYLDKLLEEYGYGRQEAGKGPKK